MLMSQNILILFFFVAVLKSFPIPCDQNGPKAKISHRSRKKRSRSITKKKFEVIFDKFGILKYFLSTYLISFCRQNQTREQKDADANRKATKRAAEKNEKEQRALSP